jgi:hypothetical protein
MKLDSEWIAHVSDLSDDAEQALKGGGVFTHAHSARDGMMNMYDQLEPDAQRTLNYLARRLLDGQKAYGKLDLASDPRDWKKERGEEIADLLVYTAFESLKQTLQRP